MVYYESSEDLNSSKENNLEIYEILNSIYRRKKILLFVTGIIITSSILGTALLRRVRPLYKGTFSLLVSDPFEKNQQKGNSMDLVFKDLATNSSNNDIPTLIQLLKSPLLLQKIADKYDIPVNKIVKSINITPGGGKERQNVAKGVLNVTYYSRDFKKGLPILILLKDEYLKASLEQRQKRLSDGLNFLNNQAPRLEDKALDLQTQLANFRINNSQIEPLLEGGVLKKREETLIINILNIEAENSRLKDLREKIDSGLVSALSFQDSMSSISGPTEIRNGLKSSETDQKLIIELQELKNKIAKARTIFTPDSRTIRDMEDKLNVLKPLIKTNQFNVIDVAIDLNNSKLNILRDQQEKLKILFKQQPNLIKQYEALQQKLLIAQENLSGLFQARETFQLEMAQNTVPWRVLSKPYMASYPVSPSFKDNIIYGLIFGIGLGVLLSLIRDRLDYVYRNPKDIENALKIPLIGNIPFFDLTINDNESIIQSYDLEVKNKSNNKDYDGFIFQEALRSINTSIRFLKNNNETQLLVISSSKPGEGKSYSNIFIAKSFADIGLRVLLIDGDMRKPQLHKRLFLNNISGLSNILSSTNTNWKNCIQNVNGSKNFSVITAGIIPPDSTRLLSSINFEKFVKEVKDSGDFDYVLFDVPPFLGLADASLIGKFATGILMIVSIGDVNRKLPLIAKNKIKEMGITLLGFISNYSSKEILNKDLKGYNSYDQYSYSYLDNVYSSYGSEEDKKLNEPEEMATKNISEFENSPKKYIHKLKNQLTRLLNWLDI